MTGLNQAGQKKNERMSRWLGPAKELCIFADYWLLLLRLQKRKIYVF
jgi:hypothetical protein